MFAGMLGVTGFGLIFTPVFYAVIRRLFASRRWNAGAAPNALAGPAE